MANLRRETILNVYGKDPGTLNELAECVRAVIESQTNARSWDARNPTKTSKPVKKLKVLSFAWNIHYSEQILKSEKINSLEFNPGFVGRVWIRYEEEPIRGSTPFALTSTYPGTGGLGSYFGPSADIAQARYLSRLQDLDIEYPEVHCYSWDYHFYLSDWPELTKSINKHKMWNKLKDNGQFSLRHRYEWIDPATKIADEEFIAQVNQLSLKKIKI